MIGIYRWYRRGIHLGGGRFSRRQSLARAWRIKKATLARVAPPTVPTQWEPNDET
jgi:hypothetical protein